MLSTTMNKISGDLLEYAEKGYFDIIIHGCNCFHKMGAGIAKQISNKYPEVLFADKESAYGCSEKLGTFTCVTIHNPYHTFVIVNGYTQYQYGSKNKDIDYKALRLLFRNIKLEYSGKHVAFPKIGAGLAGGNWSRIKKIINEELEGEDYTYVKYST
jgi:O-acetyl-ADP-ribose deacetylase (regulator of RNase III)